MSNTGSTRETPRRRCSKSGPTTWRRCAAWHPRWPRSARWRRSTRSSGSSPPTARTRTRKRRWAGFSRRRTAAPRLSRRWPPRSWCALTTPRLQGDLRQWPAWLYPTLRARRALDTGDSQGALQALQALSDARDGDDLAAHPAPWLTLLEAAWRASRWTELRAVAAKVRSRWPDAILPDLVLGAALMRDGQHEQGAALLHGAAARDPGGQAPCRLGGPGHPYRHLWPPAAVRRTPRTAAGGGRRRPGA
ncbi:MAG: hypothetical protein M5R40_05660 [Anaerolineae bacterium]|nr:hypothetical protein [Anaerolineae bacterium]